MRNLLVHEYFSVDLEEVWSTVVRDLPALKVQVQALLEVEFLETFLDLVKIHLI